MIAAEYDLSGGLADVPAPDAGTPRRAYDEAAETDPAGAFLTEAAMPSDPDRAVIVAVIDDAVPFAHEAFRIGDTASRFASVWFQDAPSPPRGSDLPMGREVRGGEISRLLGQLDRGDLADEDALYRAARVLDMGRAKQRLAVADGHGAAVAGLAAGWPKGDGATGRQMPLIAVCLPARIIRDTLGTLAPDYVMLAVLHILHRSYRLCRYIERAQGRPAMSVTLPVVINLSYGLTAGPKDGTSRLERFLDSVSGRSLPGLGSIRVVAAMGNHRQGRLRARLADGVDRLEWQTRPDDRTLSYLEIWGSASDSAPADPMQIACRPPGGSEVATAFTAHGTWQSLMDGGREIARAYLQFRDGREVMTLVLPPTLPRNPGDMYYRPGRWGVRIVSGGDGPFDACIQRDDTLPDFGGTLGRQSRLLDPGAPTRDVRGRIVERDPPGKSNGVLRTGTMSTFAGGRQTIRVGGRYAATGRTAFYSGLDFAGSPDEEGHVLADAETSIARPGVPTIGLRSGGRSMWSGTSMAAPLAARALALAYVEGAVAGEDLDQIVSLLRHRLENP